MLFQVVLLQPKKFKEGFSPKAVHCNKVFTVKVDLNEIMCDDNGVYMKKKSVKTYYYATFQSETTLSAKYAQFDANSYFVKQRESRSYVNMIFPNNKVYLIKRIYRENKNFKSLQYLVVRVKKITIDEYERFYCVVHCNLGPETKDQPLKLPHRNSKTLTAPYIRTSKAVLEREEELLHRDSTRPSIVYDKLIRENDTYTSYSQSEEPRNLMQVHNRQYIRNKAKKQPVSQYFFYCNLKSNSLHPLS